MKTYQVILKDKSNKVLNTISVEALNIHAAVQYALGNEHLAFCADASLDGYNNVITTCNKQWQCSVNEAINRTMISRDRLEQIAIMGHITADIQRIADYYGEKAVLKSLKRFLPKQNKAS